MSTIVDSDTNGWPLQPKSVRASFGLTGTEALLLPLVLGAGLVLLTATLQVALVNTLGLFLVVVLIGLWRCRATTIRLADTKLRVLGTLWLIKLSLTLFLLYTGWMPQLDPALSDSWGYDPQRYYQDAYDLIETGWNVTQSTNYQGIIFYYGALFYLFGHNPVIPALINAFVTLLGTLFLIRVAYELKTLRGPRDWTLAYLLLIPEIVWYDVMTGRETLVAVLVLVSTLSIGQYLVGPVKMPFLRTALIGGACLVALLAVRTSMAIPVVVSVVMMGLFLPSEKRLIVAPKLLFIALVFGLLALGPLVQTMIGGYDIEYISLLLQAQSFEANVAAEMEWSDNSIGLLLAPNNAFEFILFLVPRAILYLVAPLPNIAIPITDLLDGSYVAWQRLLTIPTSLMMIGALPYALAGFSLALKQRKKRPAPLVLYISFWVTLAAIAGGNIIIHERYRVMMTLLLFACAWLGYTSCTKQHIRRYAILWYVVLTSAAVFYMIYKQL